MSLKSSSDSVPRRVNGIIHEGLCDAHRLGHAAGFEQNETMLTTINRPESPSILGRFDEPVAVEALVEPGLDLSDPPAVHSVQPC